VKGKAQTLLPCAEALRLKLSVASGEGGAVRTARMLDLLIDGLRYGSEMSDEPAAHR
jgi:hypothetical protein